MMIEEFKEAIANAKARPKGIKVTEKMWKELKNSNLIQMKDTAIFGIIESGFKLPFYEDIYIFIDPELEFQDQNFQLPPASI